MAENSTKIRGADNGNCADKRQRSRTISGQQLNSRKLYTLKLTNWNLKKTLVKFYLGSYLYSKQLLTDASFLGCR